MNQKLGKGNIQTADLVLRNGFFITMDPTLPEATALAIQEGRIAWIGEEKNVSSWIGNNTQVIDLQGGYGYPGFIDTHMHVFYTGMVKGFLQLHESPDKSTILNKVKTHICDCAKEQWVFGVGWDDHTWLEKKNPNAADLDSVSPNNPVVLVKADTHLMWVNSIVLEKAGINAHTPDPEGGKIERDAKGSPTGILMDRAMFLIYKILPVRASKDYIMMLQSVLGECLQKGITTVHNAATDENDLQAFKYLASEKQLQVRVYLMAAIKDKSEKYFLESHPQAYGPFLTLRCIKLWMDGAMGSRGAALFEPYSDNSNNYGLLLWKEEDLIPIFKEAKSRGFQVAMHAIGDKAAHCVLDAYEKIGVKGLRWRIEHAQQLAASDIKRFAELEVIASMQPMHCIADMAWLESCLGNERTASGSFVWRSLLNNGAMIVGGSDSPVADCNPLWGIYAAITRQNFQQLPEQGWHPEQKMSRQEALQIYTIHAAYSCFAENELGSLTPGKWADLVVLPENLLTCPPKALLDMKVIYTIVNGVIVYAE